MTSAVSSVLYYSDSIKHEVTKAGAYVYHGDAASFYEWEFRTSLRTGAIKDGDKLNEEMTKVIEALRGDGFVVAQDVGLEKLLSPEGTKILIDEMRKMVFPLRTHEAKELFRLYGKTRGPLSRQQCESMTQYVS